MKTIHMLDEKDVRQEVNDTLSCAYEGRDWCEDGSVRQEIKDLTSNLLDMDEDMQDLKLEGLTAKNLIDNNLSVLASHEEAIKLIKNSLFAIEGMLKIHDQKIDVLVKGIAEIDSLETLKRKLSALNINADKGGKNV